MRYDPTHNSVVVEQGELVPLRSLEEAARRVQAIDHAGRFVVQLPGRKCRGYSEDQLRQELDGLARAS